jgi:GDSL-like Lipase/Acylhydrolase family
MVALATPGSARAEALAGLEVETQARLGGDTNKDGLIDGAMTPKEAQDARLRLVLRGTGAACHRGARRVWRIDGRPVRGIPAGPCQIVAVVPAEGTYRVRLETSGIAEPQSVERDVRAVEHLVVSIGDSVASAEGNPDVRADLAPARWLHRICHRSLRSGHAQAALDMERAERASAVTFVPLACSGATIPRGLLGPYVGIDPDRARTRQPPQVEVVNRLAARREIDALLVSIGANDVHFGAIVQFCAALKDCPRRRFDPRTSRREARDRGAPTLDRVVTDALARLKQRYAELHAALSERIEPQRVILVQYFDPTRGRGGRFCTAKLGPGRIVPAESNWAARRVLGRLNAVIAETGRTYGWTVVGGVAEAFNGHGICARGRAQRWVRKPLESFFRQDAALRFASLAGTLHPNARGHLATARMIRPRLGAVLRVASSADAEATQRDDEDEIFGMRTVVAIMVGVVVVVLVVAGIVAGVVTRRHRRRR